MNLNIMILMDIGKGKVFVCVKRIYRTFFSKTNLKTCTHHHTHRLLKSRRIILADNLRTIKTCKLVNQNDTKRPIIKAPIMTDEEFERHVNLEGFSDIEMEIYNVHKEAVEQGKEMYIDPETGYEVMTRLAHIKRGNCCGRACRHCPYGQEAVPPELKTKKFNSAFYY